MLNLKKIAITGGLASGKSSVCRFFEDLGAFVVSSDAIVHELLKDPQSSFRRQIAQLLGVDAGLDEVELRKSIAEKVFKDPKLLASLETILHPAVLHRIETLYAAISKQQKYAYFVVEVPLLFELGWESFYDVVVTVIADEQEAQNRFERAGFSKQDYALRMKRQMDPEEKKKKSNYILQNNGTLEDLKKQVVSLHQKIQKN
jgi:dephospho-CoA kinase